LNFLDRFKKVIIKFHADMCSGSQIVPCLEADLRTDRHDEANSCSLQHGRA